MVRNRHKVLAMEVFALNRLKFTYTWYMDGSVTRGAWTNQISLNVSVLVTQSHKIPNFSELLTTGVGGCGCEYAFY